VPLNESDTILDLIQPDYEVVVVSRHYLGSINHTLLTLKALTDLGFRPYILFSGSEHPTTEAIIRSKSGLPVLGRLDEQAEFNKEVVSSLAEGLKPALRRYQFL
jgi:dethiobiotin synthetase